MKNQLNEQQYIRNVNGVNGAVDGNKPMCSKIILNSIEND